MVGKRRLDNVIMLKTLTEELLLDASIVEEPQDC
jgi:hypothetical protein